MLRWHIDATHTLPSVVILGFESRLDEEDLRARAEFLAHRRSWSFLTPSADGFSPWARTTLPVAGLLWLRLTGEPAEHVRAATATLNELRGRLHRPESGILVVAADWSSIAEIARFAGDFWAVASFVLRVGHLFTPPEPPPVPKDTAEQPRSLPLVLPPAYRSPEVAPLLRDLQQVVTLLPADRAGATKALATAQDMNSENPSPLTTVLLEIIRATVAAGLKDPATVDQAVHRVATALARLPHDRDLLVLSERLLSFLTGHCGPAALAPVAAVPLQVARDLHTTLGTPESARDLSISLNNTAKIALRRGDTDHAATAYDESLHLRRDLHTTLGTPESARDLAVVLLNSARLSTNTAVAQARTHEAVELLRSVDQKLGTAASYEERERAEARLREVLEQQPG